MTEKLKHLMDEKATTPDFPVPDLAFVRAAGLRRRRKQHAGVVGVAVLTIAAAAAVAVTVVSPGGDSEDAIDPADRTDTGTVQTLEPTYSFDHEFFDIDGGVVADAGRQVRAYVQTPDGFVLTDPQGRVWTLLDGVSEQVGRTEAEFPELVSDARSSMAGWVDTSGPEPRYVVTDTATGETRALDVDTSALGTGSEGVDVLRFYALDGGTAYVRDSGGASAVDVASGEPRDLGRFTADNGIDGARDGNIVFTLDRGSGQVPALGPDLDTPSTVFEDTEPAGRVVFSPDGRYLSLDLDTATVADRTTGTSLELGLPGFSSGYQWTDDRTLLVLTIPPGSPTMQAVSCRVPEKTCTTVNDDLVRVNQLDSGRFNAAFGETTAD